MERTAKRFGERTLRKGRGQPEIRVGGPHQVRDIGVLGGRRVGRCKKGVNLIYTMRDREVKGMVLRVTEVGRDVRHK